jgi:hypothetical protein
MGAKLQLAGGSERLRGFGLFRGYLLNLLNPVPRIGLELSACAFYLSQSNEYQANTYFLVTRWDRFFIKFQ